MSVSGRNQGASRVLSSFDKLLTYLTMSDRQVSESHTWARRVSFVEPGAMHTVHERPTYIYYTYDLNATVRFEIRNV